MQCLFSSDEHLYMKRKKDGENTKQTTQYIIKRKEEKKTSWGPGLRPLLAMM